MLSDQQNPDPTAFSPREQVILRVSGGIIGSYCRAHASSGYFPSAP
jgi:hypothetical protein